MTKFIVGSFVLLVWLGSSIEAHSILKEMPEWETADTVTRYLVVIISGPAIIGKNLVSVSD